MGAALTRYTTPVFEHVGRDAPPCPAPPSPPAEFGSGVSLAASRAQQLTGATTDDGELRGGFVFLIVVAVVLVVLVCGGCAYYQNAKKKKAVEVGLDADSLKFEGVGP